MKQRGRQAAARLELPPVAAPRQGKNGVAGGRIQPPAKLTVEQKRIWAEVVNNRPIGWFRLEDSVILTQYCRQQSICDDLNERIEVNRPATKKKLQRTHELAIYNKLIAMLTRQTATLVRLARALRLTPSTRYSSAKAPGTGGGGNSAIYGESSPAGRASDVAAAIVSGKVGRGRKLTPPGGVIPQGQGKKLWES